MNSQGLLSEIFLRHEFHLMSICSHNWPLLGRKRGKYIRTSLELSQLRTNYGPLILVILHLLGTDICSFGFFFFSPGCFLHPKIHTVFSKQSTHYPVTMLMRRIIKEQRHRRYTFQDPISSGGIKTKKKTRN